MESRSNHIEYEKVIGRLEGNAFQEEVCARLRNIFVDFQTTPAKPHGDGGLDGLSHGQEHAYCCYGPEQDVRKLDNKGLKDSIVNKFSGDLRKLFELDFAKRKLKHVPNAELETIMGDGRKIKHIRLIVSCFDSHRIIGPLNTNFDRYKAASQKKFVAAEATLTVWGPNDLVSLGAVDEHTLFRIQNPNLIKCVQTASANEFVKDSGMDFDAKIADLKRRRPESAAKIDDIALRLREAWAAAIALDSELSKTSLGLHEELEAVRSTSALSARVKSMSETDPYQLINAMDAEVSAQLTQGFGNRLGMLTPRISQGVVAGLIGECPIDWRGDDAKRV